jgi:hypothetical protein
MWNPFPALKRVANERCAYGAAAGTLLMQSSMKLHISLEGLRAG